MTASDACLRLIRMFEGFVPRPYLCPAGVPTIGYGSTRYPDGTPVRLTDPAITMARADDILSATLREYEAAVRRCVQVPLQQHEFDALVDFAYNAGPANLVASTLLRKLNAGDRAGAAAEFERWVFAKGKRLEGLARRRKAERELFEGHTSPATNPTTSNA